MINYHSYYSSTSDFSFFIILLDLYFETQIAMRCKTYLEFGLLELRQQMTPNSEKHTAQQTEITLVNCLNTALRTVNIERKNTLTPQNCKRKQGANHSNLRC